SLETLESLPADLSPNQEAWAFVLKCVAQRFLGHHETPTSFETVVSLIECARRTKVERIATRALYCAAIITASTRDGPSIDSVLAALESTPISDDSELLLEVSLARAMLYAYAGRPVDCEAAISPALGLIISRERNGSVRATSVNGLGALLCGLGQYERALPHFETAYEMARRLDNDAIVCLATANAALCFGRLGKYQDQVCWGDKSLAAAGTSYTGHREIVACYSIAFGHAMLHRVDEALHQVADFEPRLPSTLPSWQIQGWLLGKADILMACGKRRQAIEIASAALESHNYELQAIG